MKIPEGPSSLQLPKVALFSLVLVVFLFDTVPAKHSLFDPHKIDGPAQIECQLRDFLRISGLATPNKERDKGGKETDRLK